MAYEDFLEYTTQVSPLSADNLAALFSITKELTLRKGDVLLKAGELCTCYYLVHTGYLRSFYDKDGVDINTHFTFEGRFVTNMKSMKTVSPSEFTIEAGEPSTAWAIDAKKLASLANDVPEIMLFTRRILSRMLLKMEEHSNLFKLYTPKERYAFIEQNHPRLLQRVSLSQLASYLGVTRETLSRIRKKK